MDAGPLAYEAIEPQRECSTRLSYAGTYSVQKASSFKISGRQTSSSEKMQKIKTIILSGAELRKLWEVG